MAALLQGKSLLGVRSKCPSSKVLETRRTRNIPKAWNSLSENSVKPKGYDRPWITGSQTAAPPSTSDLQGDPMGVLMKQRTVFLGGEVEDVGADALVSQLLLLDSQDPGKDIKLFINSPGGSVTAGMGIYDAMLLCRSDIQTHCFGLAASMGAFLLGAGTRGKRYSLPNSRIMIHQPLGGAGGQAVDIEIQAKEIMYHKATLNKIMAEYSKQPLSKLEQDTDRDYYMSPVEAKAYGIIDHVVGGDDACFNVKGSSRRFPKVKEHYLVDREDLTQRNIMDGAPFLPARPSHRFSNPKAEPYMRSMTPGKPWFRIKKVTKEEYRGMLEAEREAAEQLEAEQRSAGALPEESSAPQKSAKQKIDESW